MSFTSPEQQGSWLRLLGTLGLLLLALPTLAGAETTKEVVYITGTDGKGVTRSLAVDRTPALYTGSFGDCLGGESLFNITKFDAAYYADNMTVLFHLDGTTNLRNESLMLVITMEAYGESRYTQTFDPCSVNMVDLCPLNASNPIHGYASFALGTLQTSAIPDIALTIPDFDGYVSLQIFANSSQSEIGCFQAVMTNGNTLSLPTIIAPSIGVFVVVALLASFATATYGSSVSLMRAHHAHSLSVLLIIETMQSIFLTGTLSVHWPSILISWFSNFAWTVGLINVPKLVTNIGTFSGVTGNASQVGGAGSTFINNGGGRLAGQIYSRSIRRTASHAAGVMLARRKYYNASDPYDYSWGGDPVSPGIPLPGTFQSFSGTLSELGIPGASAFTLSLFWMVMAALAFPAAVLAIKGSLELFAAINIIRKDRLAFFRTNYVRYAVQIMLRTLLAAFLPLMALAVFQMTLNGSSKTTALAAIVFVLNIGSLSYLVFCVVDDRISGVRGRRLLPFMVYKPKSDKGKEKSATQDEEQPAVGQTIPPASDAAVKEPKGKKESKKDAVLPKNETPSGRPGVHQDEKFIERFGWLVARFREDRWWFPAVYLFLQLVRTCILGGGGTDDNGTYNGPAAAQVIALLILDVVILGLYLYWRPFDGRRNLAMGVWVLCSARVLVTALCIPLLPQVNISRIGATAIGLVIVVVQVLKLITMLILIVASVVTSWWSVTRNHERKESEPPISAFRQRYLDIMQANAMGTPPPPPPPTWLERRRAEREAERLEASLPPPPPSFNVLEVRRAPKIEDLNLGGSDDEDEYYAAAQSRRASRIAGNRSRPGSIKSRPSSLHQRGSSWTLREGSTVPFPTVEETPAVRNERGEASGTNGMSRKSATNSNVQVDAEGEGDENDTVGDLEIHTAEARRRANSAGNLIGNASVGQQIFDPSRVIARHNRSRTNSMNSLRSVPSGSGSLYQAQLALANADAASSTPIPSRPVSFAGSVLLAGAMDIPMNGRMTPTTAGIITDRMTPTKDILQRHASERYSKSTPLPLPAPDAELEAHR